MITIGMNYQVIEGKQEQFLKGFEGVAKALTKAEGHTESKIYSDCQEKNNYLIISEWKDEEAYQNFITSEGFRNITTWAASEILLSRPTHKIY